MRILRIKRSLKLAVDILNNLVDAELITGYTLIGGVAVSLWGRYRATDDIDFLIQATDLLVPIVDFLNEKFQVSAVLKSGDWDDPIRFMIIFYVEDVKIDLLVSTRISESHAILNSELRDLGDGIEAPLVSVYYLIILKLRAFGPDDIKDIKNVLSVREDIDFNLLMGLAVQYGVGQELQQILAK